MCVGAWEGGGGGDEDILHYYPLAKTQQKVVVGRRPCEPLNNLTLLSLAWEEEATLKERATLPLSD